jgi:5-methyltetrahydrofolate--homocysteine methyltransferase
MEAGLRWMGGRAILNSANLEDGEAEGSRLDRVMKLAKVSTARRSSAC